MDWINLCEIERKTQDDRYCQHCVKSFRFSGFAFQADRPTKGFADRISCRSAKHGHGEQTCSHNTKAEKQRCKGTRNRPKSFCGLRRTINVSFAVGVEGNSCG